jgi:hypothetical protein
MMSALLSRSRTPGSRPPGQDQVDYINDLARERNLPTIKHMPAGSSWRDADALIDRLLLVPKARDLDPEERASRGWPATPAQRFRLAKLQEEHGQKIHTDGLTKVEASRAITRLEGKRP